MPRRCVVSPSRARSVLAVNRIVSHRNARRIGEKLALSEEQCAERLRRLAKRLHGADGLDRDALRYVEQTGDEWPVLRGLRCASRHRRDSRGGSGGAGATLSAEVAMPGQDRRPGRRRSGASLRPELLPREAGCLLFFGHVAENAARRLCAESVQVAPLIEGPPAFGNLSARRRLPLALCFASARVIHAPPPFFGPACSVLMRS
jgi:hypothetical protein